MGHRLEHTIWPDWRRTEPKVVTADVTAILRKVAGRATKTGESVALVAAKARPRPARSTASSRPRRQRSLDLADRLCVAAEAHVGACRLVWPDGRVTSYLS